MNNIKRWSTMIISIATIIACMTGCSNSELEDMQLQLENANSSLTDIQAQLKSTTSSLTETQTQLESATSSLSDTQTQLKEAQDKLIELEAYIKDLESTTLSLGIEANYIEAIDKETPNDTTLDKSEAIALLVEAGLNDTNDGDYSKFIEVDNTQPQQPQTQPNNNSGQSQTQKDLEIIQKGNPGSSGGGGGYNLDIDTGPNKLGGVADSFEGGGANNSLYG